MKDPSEVHYEVEDGDGFMQGSCAADGEDWPCKVWRKWQASSEYRVAMTEREVRALWSVVGSQRKLIDDLRDEVHRLKAWTQGVTPALGDLLGGVTGGTISISEQIDHEDITSVHSPAPVRVAARREYNVDYESVDGRSYRNGRWTGTEYRKP